MKYNIGPRPAPLYKTRLGSMYVGASDEVLNQYPLTRRKGKVQLIFTSPPFVLNRKKRYGNLQGQDYVRWIASFAPLFRDYLKENGSIVLELGNGWDRGQPTMSTLAIEALLEFKKEGNFHLCQEFICFNPARLPTPAQWVTVKRCRVKDAFTRIWWMSTSPYPKADNRQILSSYSESMKRLLEKGTYSSGKRPSEHHIGARSFLRNSGGAIPPNVLVPTLSDIYEEMIEALSSKINVMSISNTGTNDSYQKFCRENGLTPHPARMPARLAEFFINFLSEAGDIVLDPFSGSNTTGAVAESLNRKWISIEANGDYAEHSIARFKPKSVRPR